MKLSGNKFLNFDFDRKFRISFYHLCVSHERGNPKGSYLSLLTGTYHRPPNEDDFRTIHRIYRNGHK